MFLEVDNSLMQGQLLSSCSINY
uniref:Uncharacterized protein n=1 Tax=Arundo donax TaxID=35708 RepID=A0A0A9DWN6_ARUDO